MQNKKEIVTTDRAPKAIGPYSQAVKSGPFLFCSGQIPLDPVTGQLVSSDVGEQIKQVMKNVEGLLAAGGCTFESVVKATIFLKSMGDFPKVNEVYATYF